MSPPPGGGRLGGATYRKRELDKIREMYFSRVMLAVTLPPVFLTLSFLPGPLGNEPTWGSGSAQMEEAEVRCGLRPQADRRGRQVPTAGRGLPLLWLHPIPWDFAYRKIRKTMMEEAGGVKSDKALSHRKVEAP